MAWIKYIQSNDLSNQPPGMSRKWKNRFLLLFSFSCFAGIMMNKNIFSLISFPSLGAQEIKFVRVWNNPFPFIPVGPGLELWTQLLSRRDTTRGWAKATTKKYMVNSAIEIISLFIMCSDNAATAVVKRRRFQLSKFLHAYSAASSVLNKKMGPTKSNIFQSESHNRVPRTYRPPPAPTYYYQPSYN